MHASSRHPADRRGVQAVYVEPLRGFSGAGGLGVRARGILQVFDDLPGKLALIFISMAAVNKAFLFFKGVLTASAAAQAVETAAAEANAVANAAQAESSGLVVVDLDVAKPWQDIPAAWLGKGVDCGGMVLDQLCYAARQPFPFETYSVRTGRGGLHLYFRHPATGPALRNTSGERGNGLGWLIDTRAHGGYVVAAPSMRPEGAYRWVAGCELDVPPERLPDPPAWLAAELDRLADEAQSAVIGPSDGNLIPEGVRNDSLARLAGAMRRAGMSQAEIAAALTNSCSDERG